MDNNDVISDEVVHCLDVFGVLHRSPQFCPKKSLDAVVSEVTPIVGEVSPSSSPTRRSRGDSTVLPKTSPFLKRSLKRALLTPRVQPERNAGMDLNSTDGETVHLVDNGSNRSSSSSSKVSALDYMTRNFPGRSNEIKQLLYLLEQPSDSAPPVFVYGPSATGKTSVVREAMRVLRRPHAYVSCRSSHTPRLMFESILNQLVDHVRSASVNFGSAWKCESLIDFTKRLPGACAQALSRKASQDKMLRSLRKNRVPRRRLEIYVLRR